MIPKWQWWVLGGLMAFVVMLDVLTSTNSYAYYFLSGKCSARPVPAPCLGGRR